MRYVLVRVVIAHLLTNRAGERIRETPAFVLHPRFVGRLQRYDHGRLHFFDRL